MSLLLRLAVPDERRVRKIERQSVVNKPLPEDRDRVALINAVRRDQCSPNICALHELVGLPVPAANIVEVSGFSPALEECFYVFLLVTLHDPRPAKWRVAHNIGKILRRNNLAPVNADCVALSDAAVALERDEVVVKVRDFACLLHHLVFSDP